MKERDDVIILGTSRNMWEEYEKAHKMFDNRYDLMTINAASLLWRGQVNHVVSYHKEALSAARIMRNLMRPEHKGLTTYHTNKVGDDWMRVWQFFNTGGTSGFFAFQVARELGYKRIVMCGVALDKAGHFYDPKNMDFYKKMTDNTSGHYLGGKDAFEKYAAEHDVRNVHVMGGRLKDIFRRQ